MIKVSMSLKQGPPTANTHHQLPIDLIKWQKNKQQLSMLLINIMITLDPPYF